MVRVTSSGQRVTAFPVIPGQGCGRRHVKRETVEVKSTLDCILAVKRALDQRPCSATLSVGEQGGVQGAAGIPPPHPLTLTRPPHSTAADRPQPLMMRAPLRPGSAAVKLEDLSPNRPRSSMQVERPNTCDSPKKENQDIRDRIRFGGSHNAIATSTINHGWNNQREPPPQFGPVEQYKFKGVREDSNATSFLNPFNKIPSSEYRTYLEENFCVAPSHGARQWNVEAGKKLREHKIKSEMNVMCFREEMMTYDPVRKSWRDTFTGMKLAT